MTKTKPTSVTKTAVISVPTNVLESVARWTGTDETRPHLHQVFFSKGVMVAVDGHRMVIAPCETFGLTLGVARGYLLAAVAAQRAMKDGQEITLAPVDVDPSLKVFSPSLIRLGLDSRRPEIGLLVPAADARAFPSYEDVVKISSKQESDGPEGYGLDPNYLADIAEVTNQTCDPGMRGVKVVAWSKDRLGAMVFENTAGVKFLIMPMRI